MFPESERLRKSPHFQNLKQELIRCVMDSAARVSAVRPPDRTVKESGEYARLVAEFSKLRGRDLYFPMVASGLGAGPFVELMDGSVKYDLITGIGIHFFGHAHPEIIGEVFDGLPGDVMQGNLSPAIEMQDFLKELLGTVGPLSKLAHGWLTCSGTMANEVALKIIRQKKWPATRVFAFEDCFAGRSTAMQEITDNPAYRQGQPSYGEVTHLPFFSPVLGLNASIERTLTQMSECVRRFPDKYCCVTLELVQGEGGFRAAPREFYEKVFEKAKSFGLAVWVDEVQTFGRTGEYFATQKFQLDPWVDVMTVGKMLQCCAVLFTSEYNPKPGLVAGTFSGSTSALRSGRKVLQLLSEGNFLGSGGKINQLSSYFVDRLENLKKAMPSCIGEIRGIGGMIAFQPFSGKLEEVKKVLLSLFDLGVVAFYCGHDPYLIRFLPPLGVLEFKHIDEIVAIIGVALEGIAKAEAGKKV